MNQLDPSAGMMWRPVDNIGASASWLRGRLAEESVRVHPASHLARALTRLDEYRALALQDGTFKFTTTDLAYDFFADAVGADFLCKTLHAGWEAGFRAPSARWADLGSGDPIVTKRGPPSTQRNLTWEVVIASLAATFATDVRLAEPDIVCTFERKTFAIAAKVAYSENKLFENVQHGFHQANGKADATLVFVDVVGLYPVPETLRWSRSRNFGHGDEAVSVMKAAVNRWCDRFALMDTLTKVRERAKNPVGVAFFVPMFLELVGAPRPFFYTHLPITWGEDAPDYQFATAFLRACNTILGFAPKDQAAVR